MFCMKCGNEIEDDSQFCKHCGQSTDTPLNSNPIVHQPVKTPHYSGTVPPGVAQPAYIPPTDKRRKEPAMAFLLSFLLLPGAGVIYAGKIMEGIIIIAVCALAIGLGIASLEMDDGMPLGIAMSVLLFFGLLMGHVYGYMAVNNYNQFLEKHGRPPQSGDKW